jgi:Tfp pilus assembly protein PilN
MTHQINLCTSLHIEKAQRFSANSLALALALVLTGGGVLGGLWLWNIDRTAGTYRQSIAAQERDMQGLRATLEAARTKAAPADPLLRQQLDGMRAELARRQILLASVRDGVVRPGFSHSDRLRLVAESIPVPVWVTGLQANTDRLEISGYTLEPSALNDWVTRLAKSPLLQGSQLATVRVDNVSAPDAASGRPVWSFNLVAAGERP